MDPKNECRKESLPHQTFEKSDFMEEIARNCKSNPNIPLLFHIISYFFQKEKTFLQNFSKKFKKIEKSQKSGEEGWEKPKIG